MCVFFYRYFVVALITNIFNINIYYIYLFKYTDIPGCSIMYYDFSFVLDKNLFTQ